MRVCVLGRVVSVLVDFFVGYLIILILVWPEGGNNGWCGLDNVRNTKT